MSGELSTGMVKSTLAAVPTRPPVIWATMTVCAVLTAVAMLVTSPVALVAAQALTDHYLAGFSLGDPGVLRVVLGTGLCLTLVGIMGGMVGWTVRSTLGALVSYFALMLLFPMLFGKLLGTWGKDIAEYLPTRAGAAFATTVPEPPALSAWPGLVVLLAWVAAGVVVAVMTLCRRDAWT